MGLLSLGTPYEWKDAAQYAAHVRKNGIEQLINIYNAHKDKKTTQLLWGDEVEYMVVKMDDKKKQALLESQPGADPRSTDRPGREGSSQ